jgi:hypothetical protein
LWEGRGKREMKGKKRSLVLDAKCAGNSSALTLGRGKGGDEGLEAILQEGSVF